MSPETKNCQNCKNDFTIEPEDFAFYEKIDVPAPTFCWECRTQRRMAFRNTRNLHKRKCHATGKDILSIYAPDKNFIVYDHKYWWGDDWNPMDYGRDYNFTQSFFTQWGKLYSTVPLQSLSNSNAVNSDYCNVADNTKNCYLCSAVYIAEDTMYSNRISEMKSSMDLYVVHRSDLCYENVFVSDSYKTKYSLRCVNCTDTNFLYDCRGCTDCFMSSNLRNKSYYFRNEQLTKEEYNKRIAEIDLGSYSSVTRLKEEFHKMCLHSIHKYANILNSVDTTGDNVEGLKNCQYCFDFSNETEDCKYLNWGIKLKDSYDCGPGVGDSADLLYEAFDVVQGSRNFFVSVVYGCSNVEYSFNCYNSSYLFGCIGLRQKQYCILNKQYTKEEYEELVPKIKQHMNDMSYIDKKGREYKYGEFFPIELSPFAYNETIAQEYYPQTKDQVELLGYNWRDKEKNKYNVTLKTEDVPDNIQDVSDDILQQVIECADAGKDYSPGAFRVTAQELQFYRQMNIPIPRKSPDARHYGRLQKRNPIKLWKRITEDGVEVMTPFAPDRPERIYSEKGYQDLIL